MTQLVWFRNDCRISDNAALTQACRQREADESVMAAFLWTPEQWHQHDYGLARQYSWSKALAELDTELAKLGIPLRVLRAGTWLDGVTRLVDWAVEQGVTQISFHREFGWDEVRRDRAMLSQAHRAGIDCRIFEDRLAFDPAGLLTGKADVYRVFTPYKKRWLAQNQDTPLAAPLPAPKPVAQPIAPSADIPVVDWPGQAQLPLTESRAHQRLDEFLDAVTRYKDRRDQPAEDGTSRLSAALANGSISLRQCLYSALAHPRRESAGVQTWLSELIWRDFYHYLLYWRPELARHEPFYPRWDAFPWLDDETALQHWKKGTTGVPIVDAGMRQLAQTGWMHNRVRMIVAMYLVKLLQINWREGERWFASQLLDIDFASNNGGWQWCASTGVDAAPYFRIFNPYTQAERFDPNGDYIRRWVPELSGLEPAAIRRPSVRQIHERGYYEPIVDYKTARADTLAAFKRL